MRKSHIYVMPDYVGPGSSVRSPEANACYKILDDNYVSLPPPVRAAFDRVLATETREGVDTRAWARSFILAYRAGDPLPERRFGKTVSVDTSTMKGSEDLSSMGRALLAVLMAGPRGVTSIEARQLGEKGGGISGGLSKLHQARVIQCLEATR